VTFFHGLLNVLMVICCLFLICLVLIQRGKGGGLAGAFGAMGGSSAFGTKAGDVFTRVTIITAGIWFLLSMGLVILNNQPRANAFSAASATTSKEVPISGSKSKTLESPSSEAAGSSSKETKPASTSGTKTRSDLPEPFEDGPTTTPSGTTPKK
jgi:preprotein translocase subunit SecG